MVVEQSKLYDMTDRERAFVMTSIEHNLRIAGEKNDLQPLENFTAGEGFIFERPDGKLWRVLKVFPVEKQVFVATLDGNHQRLWNPNTNVKIPRLYVESYGQKKDS